MATGGGVSQALSAGTHRLFFALWPDAQVRADLAQAAQRMRRVVEGRRSRDDSLHLTLAFLGDVDAACLPHLLAPPRDVFTTAFLLTLNKWGCWSHNGVAWAAPSHTPDSLRELVENLEVWLRSAGFELEYRGFTPHVTLVRKAQCAPLPDAMMPVAWQVSEFALIHSQRRPGGSRYRALGVWPLEQ